MKSSPFSLASTSSLDFSPYLTKGSDSGNGVTLMIGDVYTYLLLGSGPLLVIAAFVLVKVMYARVKFFALEFGNGGFVGRSKVIAPSIIMGSLLFFGGVAATWLGWQSMGYSVTLNAKGLHEVSRSESVHYEWSDATSAAERIKSTEFWVAFAKDGRKCRVSFQQRFIGEKLQDKAIAIAERALAYSKISRIK
ncbi:hypothetical protein [Prosthecobacter sp.]|uniref:hypothetical protein n=1 Tax=Prosthecobacter sp. TaxID=1965333 RepID=UPI002489E1FD|nr:hypothetical protein [Prosthecobacter sp.]MDI1311956.1 hypothetical protein [Prosthecobacter sp.]